MKDFLFEIAQDRKKGLVALLLKPLLYFLSLIYGITVCLISAFYNYGLFRSYRAKVKVISVGNITLGGTGKTPLVEFLASRLSSEGKKIAILSRGYNDDEPSLLKKNLASANVVVFTGRDRIVSVKKAEDLKVDAVILDDGFQHWRLKRDLDIVTINSQNAFGNKCVIPRGILREPLSSLQRAEIIMLTKVDLAKDIDTIREELHNIAPDALVVEAVHNPEYIYDLKGEKIPLSFIKEKNICLLSSIGDPESFRKIILREQAKLALNISYPDHYQYSKKDILNLEQLCKKESVDIIVTTEKDLMRIPSDVFSPEIKIFVLRIALKIIKNEKEFFDRISDVFIN